MIDFKGFILELKFKNLDLKLLNAKIKNILNA